MLADVGCQGRAEPWHTLSVTITGPVAWLLSSLPFSVTRRVSAQSCQGQARFCGRAPGPSGGGGKAALRGEGPHRRVEASSRPCRGAHTCALSVLSNQMLLWGQPRVMSDTASACFLPSAPGPSAVLGSCIRPMRKRTMISLGIFVLFCFVLR